MAGMKTRSGYLISYVNEMLLPPFDLPENIVLLITDTLPSPAFFLLNNALVAQLKQQKQVTLLSVSEDLARWKAVAAKSNVNLPQYLDAHKLRFISVPSILGSSSSFFHPPSLTSQPSLKPLYDAVANSLNPSNTASGTQETGTESNSSDHLVILDDITTLEWIGFSFLDISRFLRAIVALCRNVKATLIVRHHITTSDELDELFRRLLQLSTYHLEVRALASGRSGAISGEVALHPGPSTPPGSVKLYPRSSALQYLLTDTGATFFERGTGTVVL